MSISNVSVTRIIDQSPHSNDRDNRIYSRVAPTVLTSNQPHNQPNLPRYYYNQYHVSPRNYR